MDASDKHQPPAVRAAMATTLDKHTCGFVRGTSRPGLCQILSNIESGTRERTRSQIGRRSIRGCMTVPFKATKASMAHTRSACTLGQRSAARTRLNYTLSHWLCPACTPQNVRNSSTTRCEQVTQFRFGSTGITSIIYSAVDKLVMSLMSIARPTLMLSTVQLRKLL